MVRTLLGKVHGRTIELAEDLGVPEGQEVEIVVRMSTPSGTWGNGIRRSAGVAVDNPSFDDAFREIERERKTSQFRELQE